MDQQPKSTETYTDCRSLEGVATGLIDGIIAMARVLNSLNLSSSAVKEALKDLRSDEDVKRLLDT
jgi:hypothetical protein